MQVRYCDRCGAKESTTRPLRDFVIEGDHPTMGYVSLRGKELCDVCVSKILQVVDQQVGHGA